MKHKKFLIGWIFVVAVLAVACFLVPSTANQETIQEAMKDAVLHETGRVSLFGLKNVNPGLISGMVVTAFLLIVAALIRIFAIPKFQYVPGKFQMLLEQVVGMFDNLAKSNSPHRNGFLGAYIFAAGVYIFVGTLFELFGVQAVSISGASITLPAPLSDVNGAIALGCLSYLVILSGGIAGNGFKGIGSTLNELPSVWCTAQRTAGNRADLLLHPAELCAPGDRSRSVHAAPCADSELCAHHAHRAVLRRGFGAQSQKSQSKKETRIIKHTLEVFQNEKAEP